MEDLLRIALKEAQRLGADYADARYMKRWHEPITTKNGAVQSIARSEDSGVGVRVLVRGGWGFCSSSVITPAELRRCAAEAVRIARSSASVQREPIVLSQLAPVVGKYQSNVKIDPFALPMEAKLDLLKSLDYEMKSLDKVRVATSMLSALKYHKWFVSTEGSEIEQEILETGINISATATGNNDVQRRGFRDYSQAGFE